MNQPPPIPSIRYTVVYDGTCAICTRLSRVLRDLDRDGKLEIIPSQSPGLMTRFPWIPASAYGEALQLIGPDDTTWEGAAAIEQLVRILPKGRLVSWIYALPFMRPIADRFYRWFARNRYVMGCGDHCGARRT